MGRRRQRDSGEGGECVRLRDLDRYRSGKHIRKTLEARFEQVLAGIARRRAEAIEQLPYARWLLDNSHVVREALQQIETDLPARYLRQLARYRDEDDAGQIRIFAYLNSALSLSGLPVDVAAIEVFLQTQPSRIVPPPAPLSLGELWAVPIALRICLVSRLCAAVADNDADVAEDGHADDIERRTAEIAGCITSLRTVAITNWRDFVEASSVVERALRDDPAAVYPRMDFHTRDRYRDTVEKLALHSALDEGAIASAAVRLSTQAGAGVSRESAAHVGHYLLADGRAALQEEIGYRPSLRERLAALAEPRADLCYVLSVVSLATVGAVVLLLMLLSRGTGVAASAGAVLLATVPLLSVARGAIDLVVSAVQRPRRLPKMDFSDGIPATVRSVIVMPTMLNNPEGIDGNLRSLEQNYLANPDPSLRFVLLSDYCDSSQEESAGDRSLLEHAVQGIDLLNMRYSNDAARPFLLFHRRRLWNENAGQWMGWERKRGKLEEFNALLRGATDTSYTLMHGESLPMAEIRYVITLDADSYMPPGTAAQLIGALAHPLNRPQFEEGSGEVTHGSTIVQPRLEANPVTSADTLFSRIFAGDTLLDLYSNAVSDVYQDLFGNAIYTGKGIYDVDAFRRSTHGKIKENSILSHDLLEGLFGRVGLATDVLVLEDYPPNYLVYLQRLHRWVRGDWQLLPWLFRRRLEGERFAPGLIGRWKIFDNLQRSVLAPSLLLLLMGGWLWLAENPVLWTLVFALFPGLPILLRMAFALRTSTWRWGTVQSSVRNLAGQAGSDAARWILNLAFVPAEAFMVVDAVMRTLTRLFITRRGLLEWSSAAVVASSVGAAPPQPVFWRTLFAGPLVASLACLAIATLQPSSLPAAAPMLLLWGLSPWIAFRLSTPKPKEVNPVLEATDHRLLRDIAHDTWRFFEHFVGPDSAWLPPDNVQEQPVRIVANRTSPTNIGMMVLSTVAAYDLGYLNLQQLLSKLSDYLNSVGKLEHYRGHLLNWYSLPDRRPLEPRYVSTVDSGNLVAALITAREAISESADPAERATTTIAGLADRLRAMRRVLVNEKIVMSTPAGRELHARLERAQEQLDEADCPFQAARQLADDCLQIEAAVLKSVEEYGEGWTDEIIGDFRAADQLARRQAARINTQAALDAPWSGALATVPADFPRSCAEELQRLLKILPQRVLVPLAVTDLDAAQLCIEALREKVADSGSESDGDLTAWLESAHAGVEQARESGELLDRTRRRLLGVIDTLIAGTDFAFLYDQKRNLFRVGYNVSTGEFDGSYYDLLASEARVASFVAIAKGDVPARHWVHMARPLTRLHGLRILLSWSGTAFEYLMPRLFMHNPSRGLLSQSCEGAIQQQIRSGKAQGTPWGVSESGFAQLDAHGHYQYYAFGVSGLGLNWDQGERLVIAAYASVLALPFRPREVVHNIRQLISIDAYGHFGLYEAVDFGAADQPHLDRPDVVRSYMAHHQGMILVAIANALNRDCMLTRFHAYPAVASAEYLLYERLPRRPEDHVLERLPPSLREKRGAAPVVEEWTVGDEAGEFAVLSNGRLSCRLSHQGSSALIWRGNSATHWDPVGSGPLGGRRIYITDHDRRSTLLALGASPAGTAMRALFAPHKVEFRAERDDLLVRTMVTVAPTADVEVVKVAITNNGAKTRFLAITSYCEPVLCAAPAHLRHPAFSKLFIESEVLVDNDIILFRRRQRDAHDTPMWLACKTLLRHGEGRLEIERDRGVFFGRAGSQAAPRLLRTWQRDSEAEQPASLEPCAALTWHVELDPYTTRDCTFLTAVGDSRDSVLTQLARFPAADRVDWAFEEAAMHSERELALTRIDSTVVREAFRLLAHVMWPRRLPHVDRGSRHTTDRIQDALWRHGISGDRPLITAVVDSSEDLPAAEGIVKALAYLVLKDLLVDMVFLDDSKGGYAAPVLDRLRRIVNKHLPGTRHAPSAFVIAARNISPAEKDALIFASRVFFDLRGMDASGLLATLEGPPTPLPAFVPQPSAPVVQTPIADVELPETILLRHSLGGLMEDIEGYVLLVSADRRPPAPWCNVLANPNFGSLISDTGSMCTWWQNSSELRLTGWSNDPVLDQTGEWLCMRDEETGDVWSLTPNSSHGNAEYRVEHRIGETSFSHNQQGLEQQLRVYVDAELPLKVLTVELRNRWPRARRLTLTYLAEWVMGNRREISSHLLRSERDADSGALLVRNCFQRSGSEARAFLGASLPAHSFTTDGAEAFGDHWSTGDVPPGLNAIGFSNSVVASVRPCAAYQVHIELEPDGVERCHFFLGAADSREEALQLVANARQPVWVDKRRTALQERWSSILDVWQLRTSDFATDALVNRWLLYQVTASRLWGKIGFYQASGGFGFRDQLQDVLALLDAAPQLAREQILLASSRQFPEGDVLHWWHEQPLRGVRTRCSDDLLWLVYAVCEYVDITGDVDVLAEETAFLEGDALADGDQERYAEFAPSATTASLFEHCCRAVDARARRGAHGLPPIGNGDWCDGLSAVGKGGTGESVWMAWFLIVVYRRFAPLCRIMDDGARAESYEALAAELLAVTRHAAWSGDWYLRGFYDDGTPLGAPGDAEAEIDLIAQCWAVLADRDHPQSAAAMRAAKNKLVDDDNQLIRLLYPPFDATERDPGYIKGYPPGVRENGGQYTHAAVWAPWAAVEMGDYDAAMRWFRWLNPLARTDSEESIASYRLEPYVLPGDVYSTGAMVGRGGWSWYTGSAGWLYRLVLRRLLGFQRRGERLYLRPCLAPDWPDVEATLRFAASEYRICLHDPGCIRDERCSIACNGKAVADDFITLASTGRFRCDVFPDENSRDRWLEGQPDAAA